MSVSFMLLPALIGVIASVATGGSAAAGLAIATGGLLGTKNAAAVQVQTRMKDVGLLHNALENLGAINLTMLDGVITAQIDDVALSMSRTEEGIWSIHFESPLGKEVSEERMLELVQRLDANYALQVQAAVADRIRANAGAAGLSLVKESRDEDDTVTMLLTVQNEV